MVLIHCHGGRRIDDRDGRACYRFDCREHEWEVRTTEHDGVNTGAEHGFEDFAEAFPQNLVFEVPGFD